MATPLTADRLLAALRAEGVTVVEVADWRTHNRNHKGAWGPLNGVMIHHTVTSGTAGSVSLCYNGRSDLPGPLCHGVIAKDGSVHLVGSGRANHAGSGDPDALAAVVAEASVHPAPNTATVDGNAHFYGFECINLGDGKDPWPEAQLDAIARAAAGLCRAHGWSADSVIGHLEWTNQKVDPRGFTMRSMRDRIAERLKHPASWNPNEEDDVALTADDIKKIAVAVWTTDGIVKNPNPASAAVNPYIAAGTGLNNVEIVGRRMEAKVDALGTPVLTDVQLAALADKVAAHPALADRIAEAVAVKLAARLAN